MSWVAVAIGGATAITGAIVGNQTKQRNKGYISDSYRTAQQRLALKQRAGRQDAAEALGARGLTSGGDVNASPIKAAMVNGVMTAQGDTPHTLGAQMASDNAVQMGLETQDLEQQRDRAETENKAQYTNQLIGSVISGVNVGGQVASGLGMLNAPGAAGTGGPSAIQKAMVPEPTIRGIDNPGAWFGRIHGLDPLNAPGSSWNPNGSALASINNAQGQSNADFHV